MYDSRSFTGELLRGKKHPRLIEQHYLMIPSRYVGNTMAAFIMQALGCEVAALNTVQFSTLHHLTVSPKSHVPCLLFL